MNSLEGVPVHEDREICRQCGGWCCLYNIRTVDKSDPQIKALVEYHKVRSREWGERDKEWWFIVYQPCPHFRKNKCAIYKDRPVVCKTFPAHSHADLREVCPLADHLYEKGDNAETPAE